jgi:hypothetical protein
MLAAVEYSNRTAGTRGAAFAGLWDVRGGQSASRALPKFSFSSQLPSNLAYRSPVATSILCQRSHGYARSAC